MLFHHHLVRLTVTLPSPDHFRLTLRTPLGPSFSIAFLMKSAFFLVFHLVLSGSSFVYLLVFKFSLSLYWLPDVVHHHVPPAFPADPDQLSVFLAACLLLKPGSQFFSLDCFFLGLPSVRLSNFSHSRFHERKKKRSCSHPVTKGES